MRIEDIQYYCAQSKIKWYKHVLERMQERDISRADVKNCIMHGEIIEDYPDDFPHPSCLIFGYTVNEKVIHAVVSLDAGNDSIGIITVYFPNVCYVNVTRLSRVPLLMWLITMDLLLLLKTFRVKNVSSVEKFSIRMKWRNIWKKWLMKPKSYCRKFLLLIIQR